jgi:hypothetical protein
MVHLNKSHYNFDWTDTEKRIAEEKRYLAEMKSFCLNYNPKGGDSIEIKFPVADGYAEYMVLKN